MDFTGSPRKGPTFAGSPRKGPASTSKGPGFRRLIVLLPVIALPALLAFYIFVARTQPQIAAASTTASTSGGQQHVDLAAKHTVSKPLPQSSTPQNLDLATKYKVNKPLPQSASPQNSSWACSSEAAAQQRQQWQQAFGQKFEYMACADHKWLGLLAESWVSKDFVAFDVGCNKGYEVGLLLQLFVPQLNITNQGQYEQLSASAKALNLPSAASQPEMCGSCNHCQQPTAVSPLAGGQNSGRGHLHLHCFEPSQENHVLVNSIRKYLVPEGTKEKVSLSVYNMGMSDKVGFTDFPTHCGELCSLGNAVHGQANYTTVNVTVTTVDAHMASYSIPFIDVLKIDAEGYDPVVLLGASLAFEGKRVGVVLFEHHAVGLWKTTELEGVVERMQGYGYVCFYDGQPTMTQLTGCWQAAYGRKVWSNVVCALESHPLFEEIRALSFIGQAA